MIKTSPNQRTVLVTRDTPRGNKNKPYICVYRDSIEAASRNLTPVAFKLYLYFVSNQNNYKEAFSTAHFAELYGCDVKSAKTAFHTLVDKGYLLLDEGMKNKYTFYEIPQDTTSATPLPSTLVKNIQKKKFKDEETGEEFFLTFKELVEACEGNEEIAQQIWEVA